MNISAEEIIGRYCTERHIENGIFIEKHYQHTGEGRPASGCMYYYLAPGERSEFHVIDCDEYWICSAGAPLEIWCFDADGKRRMVRCGLDGKSEPAVYFPAGTIFAARPAEKSDEGTFVSCITVPRFRYEGSKLFEREEMIEKYPSSAEFWL